MQANVGACGCGYSATLNCMRLLGLSFVYPLMEYFIYVHLVVRQACNNSETWEPTVCEWTHTKVATIISERNMEIAQGTEGITCILFIISNARLPFFLRLFSLNKLLLLNFHSVSLLLCRFTITFRNIFLFFGSILPLSLFTCVCARLQKRRRAPKHASTI